MEFTCAVWYEGILAHYHVVETSQDTFVVRLLHCITKTPVILLPRKLNLFKRGEEWISDHVNTDFIADLASAITENTMMERLLTSSNERKEVLVETK